MCQTYVMQQEYKELDMTDQFKITYKITEKWVVFHLTTFDNKNN